MTPGTKVRTRGVTEMMWAPDIPAGAEGVVTATHECTLLAIDVSFPNLFEGPVAFSADELEVIK